ncbi:MAG: transposase [Chitinophagales bacterium]
MQKYNPDKHHRRSIRLIGYDYAQEGLYFITLCVQNRKHIFGKIENEKLCLNPIGQIAYNEWLNTAQIRDNIALHDFIVMPNHFHAILQILWQKGKEEDIGKFKSPSQTIGSIIRGYKIATIKKIKDYIHNYYGTGELQFAPTEFAPTIEIIKKLDYKIWQRNYYEHIIRNEKSNNHISQYIINNPINWEKDSLHNE